jgi:hypothetical protein
VAPFISKSGDTWPIIRDDNAVAEFGTTGVPETFIVDPYGFVIVHITGRVTESGLNTILQRAQAQSE